MQSLYMTAVGGPEVLALRSEPDPEPAAGELIVEGAFTGVNFADVAARVGVYPGAPRPPIVLGFETSGRVLAIGQGVTRYRPGDRVVAVSRFGAQTDRLRVPEDHVVPLPNNVALETAAAVPVNYITAYHMLEHVGRLRPGGRVLVHMAAGGVGLAAIQLARRIPGVEIFATASASKLGVLADAGVDHPIDYRRLDYVAEVRRLTRNAGVDLVLDALGGRDWSRGYDLLAPCGQLVVFGWSNMVSNGRRTPWRLIRELARMPRFSPMRLMQDNRGVAGVHLGYLWQRLDLLTGHLRILLAGVARGELVPRIHDVLPLREAATAHRALQERRNVGKLLLAC